MIIIDNSAVYKIQLRDVLDGSPWALEAVSEPHQALAIIHEKGPHVVLLDIDHAEDDGKTDYLLLQDCSPQSPVVLTSSIWTADEISLPARFKQFFLAKPFSRPDILAVLASAAAFQETNQLK